MVVIYTDKNLVDRGMIDKFDLDFDTTNTMDYSLTVDSSIKGIDDNGFIYIPGTEYGGIIDKKTPSTTTGTTVFYGRNFRGLLNSKIIIPAKNTDYRYINGDIYTALNSFIEEFDLVSYFRIDKESIAGYTLTNYKIARYCSLYSLILSVCKIINKSLWLYYDLSQKKIILSFRSALDQTKEGIFTNSQLGMEVTKASRLVTHMICLGAGQLKDRVTADIWLNADKKTFSTTDQSFFGLDEYTYIYENVNSGSKEDLIESGIEKFEELINVDSISVALEPDESFKIGDKIGGYEPITKTSITSTISNIIVNISDGEESISYETT